MPIISPVPADAPALNIETLLGWARSALYEYRDAAGRLLHCIARVDKGAGVKDIRPIVLTRGADGGLVWAVRAPAEPRPLYGLDLLALRPQAPVLVVEGEKTADAARAIFPDHVVVTWSGGAKAVEKADWAPLAGRDVTLWPDNDEAGRQAMARVVALLSKGRA